MRVDRRFRPAKLAISGFVIPGAQNPVIFGPPKSRALETSTFSEHYRRRNSGAPKSGPLLARRSLGALKRQPPHYKSVCWPAVSPMPD